MKTIYKKLPMEVALCMVLSFAARAQTANYLFNNSMRNKQLSHYYKMVSWDDSQYQEAAYWLSNSAGSVLEFMNWRIIFPPGYQQTGSTKYPMIVLMHGSGESGRLWSGSLNGGNFNYLTTDPQYDNNGAELIYGGQEHLAAVNASSTDSRYFPGIVAIPQVSYNGAWSSSTWNKGTLTPNCRMAVGIIEYLIKNYNVDQYKITVHGLSAGAKGVWDIAAKRPDLFCAMLPMSGVGSDIDTMTNVLVTTPIWLFQGGQDTNPSPGWSQQWINKLKAKGGDPRYTLYPNLDHGVWDTAYAEPDFFSWIRLHDKRNIYVFGGETSLDKNPAIKLGFSDGFTSYQWTKNGVDIDSATTRYYTATDSGSYAVRFTRRTDGVTDTSFPVLITPTPVQPPPQNGLAYNYYENTTKPSYSVVTFDFTKTPTASGTINNFTNSVKKRDTAYVISYDGSIQIDNAGIYTFYTYSDNGSQLSINNTLVVNNDGKAPPFVASGTYSFSGKGKYPIRVTYFQNQGWGTITVKYNQGLRNSYDSASTIPDKKLFLPSFRSVFSNPSDGTSVVTVPGVTEEGLVLFYPNPFQNDIHVQFLREDMGSQPVAVFDMITGLQLKSFVVESYDTEAVLNLGDLAPGPYILTVGKYKFRILKSIN